LNATAEGDVGRDSAVRQAVRRGLLIACTLGLGLGATALVCGFGAPIALLASYTGVIVGFGAVPFVFIERRARGYIKGMVLSFVAAEAVLCLTALQVEYELGILGNGGSYSDALAFVQARLGDFADSSTGARIHLLLSLALWGGPAAILSAARLRRLGLEFQLILAAVSSIGGVAGLLWYFQYENWLLLLIWPILVAIYELSDYCERRVSTLFETSALDDARSATEPSWKPATIAMLCLTLAIVAGSRIRASRIKQDEQEERRRTTIGVLRVVSEHLPKGSPGAMNGKVSHIRIVGGGDQLGFEAFSTGSLGAISSWKVIPLWGTSAYVGNGAVCDWWGQPIYYRCPGPVHMGGWDLISCGPNGIYEGGGGDDIVVGEDFPDVLRSASTAPVTSR
jgi:hypothetical protein